jgi:class 3 adenylate cyclase
VPASAEREVAAAVERTLLREAARNEYAQAVIRVVLMVFFAVGNYAAHLSPQPPIEHYPLDTALVALGYLVPSVLVALALKRGLYTRWLRVVLPIGDASIMVGLFWPTWPHVAHLADPARGVMVTLAAAGAIVAMSGALRLRRRAALFSTVLAVAAFDLCAWRAEVGHMTILFVSAVILAAGLMGVHLADVVRRAVSAEVARVTFERFLPGAVVAQAHDDPLALLREAKVADVTVVITDLRDFTSLSESIAPELVLAFLNEVQGRLAEAVGRHGGVVDKFMGDGMLAVFGVDGRGDHAARALAAARALRGVAREQRAPDGAPLRLGIGVHSGQVVAGCLGSGTHLEFTVVGDTVNVASRLEALTKELGHDVLVSEETARRVPDEALAPVGDVTLRGRPGPLRVLALPA